MKLAVMTAAVFPTIDEAQRKLWIFLRSWEKFGTGYDLHLFGTGRIFPGYRVMGAEWVLEKLHELKNGYSHALFSDSWDAFFCARVEEIEAKYRAMGSPQILVSAYIGLGNESDMSSYVGCFDESIPYRFPNRGGWIAEIPAMIEMLERMTKSYPDAGDECFLWYWAWRENWFRPVLDSNCGIFQVSDVNASISSTMNLREPARLYNNLTQSRPCILHLSGGYTDPETGKDEALKPWARALGVI